MKDEVGEAEGAEVQGSGGEKAESRRRPAKNAGSPLGSEKAEKSSPLVTRCMVNVES